MEQPRPSIASDLITSFERSATHEWRATLECGKHDPLFFDHALDHIPGMALVEGCLQTVEHATRQRDTSETSVIYFAAVGFEFQRFCEHGAPTEISVKTSKADPNHWQMQAIQDGALLTSGTVITRPLPERPSEAISLELEPGRADRALVHKVEPSNVLVGPMGVAPDRLLEVRLIAPALRDQWAGQSAGHRSPGELIESGRQFGTLVMHAVTGMPLDSQFVLQHFNMVLDRPTYRSEPVELRGRPGLLMKHQIRGMELVRASGRIVGHMDFSALLLPRAVYSRLRKNARELNGASRQYAADRRSA